MATTPSGMGSCANEPEDSVVQITTRPLRFGPRSTTQDDAVGAAGDELIATIAHELRAPLATLNVALDTLLDDPEIYEQGRDILIHSLQRGVVWMNGLVDNLNVWSAFQAGRATCQSAPIAISDWLEPAIVMAQPILNRRAQRVRATVADPTVMVLGDSLQLGQVLVNLLTNAGRHGPIGDVIEVDVTLFDDFLRVSVRDHGAGVAPEQRARIFEPFVRGELETGTSRGQGLGLYIVRELVALHGGHVGVEGEPGCGATFWFTLPTARATAPRELMTVSTGWEAWHEALAG